MSKSRGQKCRERHDYKHVGKRGHEEAIRERLRQGGTLIRWDDGRTVRYTTDGPGRYAQPSNELAGSLIREGAVIFFEEERGTPIGTITRYKAPPGEKGWSHDWGIDEFTTAKCESCQRCFVKRGEETGRCRANAS